MFLTAALLGATLWATVSACGGGDEADSCVGGNLYSTARSGGLCQVNVFSTPERAVYCAKNAAGRYECLCGPAAENPNRFVSDDICDLGAEARICEAVSRCGFSF